MQLLEVFRKADESFSGERPRCRNWRRTVQLLASAVQAVRNSPDPVDAPVLGELERAQSEQI